MSEVPRVASSRRTKRRGKVTRERERKRRESTTCSEVSLTFRVSVSSLVSLALTPAALFPVFVALVPAFVVECPWECTRFERGRSQGSPKYVHITRGYFEITRKTRCISLSSLLNRHPTSVIDRWYCFMLHSRNPFSFLSRDRNARNKPIHHFNLSSEISYGRYIVIYFTPNIY